MSAGSIGVVGAGTMGNGIAQAFAVAGHPVVMIDVSDAAVKRGVDTIAASLDRLVQKNRLTPDGRSAAMSRVATGTDPAALGEADLIVEAATENLEVKLKLFAQVSALASERAVLATNTSSISITRIAAASKRPDRVIGMHFFNPVAVMQLVELIRGLQTSDETYAEAEAYVKAVGKTPVQVRNSPGFVVNRMLCPMINEAVFALAEGLATAKEIDEAMRLGANHPIGPLALCDLIGLDVQLAVMNVLFEGFKDPKYRPAPLLVEMVEAGYLGRKTGRGFFTYG
jgi:3-hydroxybutyryl-CoA dehydrogenase